ncbi:MAG: T9SS C-terminal target domain-containing protein, partial [Calditrichaeota bacterium]
EKPLTNEDTLHFVTDPNYFISPVIKKLNNQPYNFTLENNYPNPFNPTTTIAFNVPRSDKIQLQVVNVLGQRVATLVDGYVLKGRYRVLFDGSGLASGIYFYTLTQNNRSITRRMMLIK